MKNSKIINTKALITQFNTIFRKRGILFLFIYIITAINDTYIKKYLRGSFSQKGEDLVIERIVGSKKRGFYIDVGANNPNIFNNTKRFYDKGWSGVNIEPNPVLIKEFQQKRVRDINLNIGIRKNPGTARFYEFEADGLSTFSKEEKDNYLKLGYKLKQQLNVEVQSLKSIIGVYGKSKIDFISIDTEGLDYEVLESNNWKKFRPTLVCIETGEFSSIIKGKSSNKKYLIDKFMGKNGYGQVFTNGLNSLYKDLRVK